MKMDCVNLSPFEVQPVQRAKEKKRDVVETRFELFTFVSDLSCNFRAIFNHCSGFYQHFNLKGKFSKMTQAPFVTVPLLRVTRLAFFPSSPRTQSGAHVRTHTRFV